MSINILSQKIFGKNLNIHSIKCMGLSFLTHIIILIILSFLISPPQGRPDAGLLDVGLESFAEAEPVTAQSAQPLENVHIPQPQEEISSEEYSLSKNVAEIQEIQKRMNMKDSEQIQQYISQRQQNISLKKKQLSEMLHQQGKISQSIQIRGQYGTLAPRSFYGVKVMARTMIFMIDISGSMNIEDAARQLKNAYKSLTSSEYFNIVAYSEEIQCWQKDLISATPENIQAANRWVDNLKNGGATNIYSALENAFQNAWSKTRPEIIYFITDGLPTFGPVQQDLFILDAVRKWNKDKNIILYVIGVGHHQNRFFLNKLATENYGKYFER